MRILAIDYGDKRTGLAISDEGGKLASRFLTLKNESLEGAVKKISQVITEKNIAKLVVGLPVGFKAESQQTGKTRQFIAKLKECIEIPIVEINEIFTSKMAEENLRVAGIKNVKDVIDQEAARIILQEYLDKEERSAA